MAAPRLVAAAEDPQLPQRGLGEVPCNMAFSTQVRVENRHACAKTPPPPPFSHAKKVLATG
jgi:hypothetical protein